jgi:hypothetical protein
MMSLETLIFLYLSYDKTLKRTIFTCWGGAGDDECEVEHF